MKHSPLGVVYLIRKPSTPYGGFRVCSVVELDGTEWDGSIPERRSLVRLRDMMEWPRSTKGNIQYRCGTHPSGQIGRTRWNGTVSPSNLIKFSYN
jgi:hypothetical protein